MSERDRTTGYNRGVKGEGSSSRWNDNWFESNETFKDRQKGYEEGRRDRARIEAEKGGSNSSGK